MHLVSISNLSKAYDDHVLFEDVSFGLTTDDRVGIVGANGAGKSTLLRILTGEEVPDSGDVVWTSGARVAYLEQRPDLGTGTALEAVMGTSDLGVQQHEAEAMLSVMNVALDMPVDAASGGQRRRVALAKTLVSPADLLILDEPTNHLDVDTVEWLEDHLKQRRGGLLVVTHDRYVLDRLATRMLEVDGGAVHWHEGGYADVLENRAIRETQARSSDRRRANLAKTELAWLRRGPKARSSKPKFRMEQAHAMQESTLADGPAQLDLGTGRVRLGKKVIAADEATFAYPDPADPSSLGPDIIRSFTNLIGPGDRIGIVGPNGAGKTTLMRMLTGELTPTSGTVERGPTVALGIYEQESTIPPGNVTALSTLLDIGSHIPLANGETLPVERLAERFAFDGRLLRLPISRLSGGERRRLALLHILVEAPNVLVLDEPTNDLDLDTLRALEQHLDGFSGTLIVASHDRYVLDRLTDRLLVVPGDGTVHQALDWDDHRDRQLARVAAPTRAQIRSDNTVVDNKTRQARRKEVNRLEKRLVKLDKERKRLEQAIADVGADYEAAAKLTTELDAARTEIDAAEERWLELSED